MSLKCILQGQDSKNLVTKVELNEHIADKNNPHEVTAEQVGALSKEVISLPDGTDFNNIVNTGLYKVFTGINAPIGGVGNYKAFMVLVASEPVSEPRLTQLAISYYQKEQSNRIFIRTIRDEWSDWRELSSADQLCNPNLLDNWYFGNPVNQRGYKLYKDIGYTIDRWKLDINPGEGIRVNDSYITLNTSGIYFGQYFDNLQNFKGKTFTGTILCADGNLYSGTFIYNAIINQGQMFFPSVNGSPGMYIQQLSDTLAQVEINTLTDNVSIIAVKLEFGGTQTLAHKEGDKWVLNEIPDYGEQLSRCQRYCVDVTPSVKFNTTYGGTLFATGGDFLVPTPVTFRESGDSNPIVICNPSEWQVAIAAADTYLTPTSISVVQTMSGAVILRCLASHSLPGQYCDLRKATDSAKLILSKDL